MTDDNYPEENMTKFMIGVLILVGMIFVAGCVEDEKQPIDKETGQRVSRLTEKWVEREYKGHVYIAVKNGEGCSVVHAAHCPCQLSAEKP